VGPLARAAPGPAHAGHVSDLFRRLHLPVKPRLPGFGGTTGWLNSRPLTAADLHGKVVLVQFWTYTCINWIRTLPYVRAWTEAYGGHGLVVVGVHTPEFGVEQDVENVRLAARQFGLGYPIALDNGYAVWNAFGNHSWPAVYIADGGGRIRHEHFGEGAYERSEQVIRQLLADAGGVDVPEHSAPVDAQGIEAPADWDDLRSPETYLGLARAEGFASPGGGVLDQTRVYAAPPHLHLNEWALTGNWTLGGEEAVLNQANGRIALRFHARDVNLILAPRSDGSPGRFVVRLDGGQPDAASGSDVAEDGTGVLDEARLYQLIRQPVPVFERSFEIEFLDAGVAAFCFTFG
jgi:thiol-disulfide isomerase/thioredoxin